MRPIYMRRNPWMRIAATVSAMAVVLLLAVSWRFLVSRGVFTSVEEKMPGVCRTVPGIGGIADIAFDTSGRVYLASSNALYVYERGSLNRLTGTPNNFRPAALSLDQGGSLHVLSGQHGRWVVSTFVPKLPVISAKPENADSLPGTKQPFVPKLEELGRLSSDVITDPADLASVDGGRFYLVNRHGTHSAFGRWLDDAVLLPRANVLYFDGMKFVTVAERLNSPAGLALSRDGAHLYVAEDFPRTLAGFSRNNFMGSLDNPAVFSLPANPRKIVIAPDGSLDGSLIVVARPKSGAGQVWRVTLENGVPQKAEMVYSHKGEEVTAAAQLGKHLLIGTPSRLLDCVSTN